MENLDRGRCVVCIIAKDTEFCKVKSSTMGTVFVEIIGLKIETVVGKEDCFPTLQEAKDELKKRTV